MCIFQPTILFDFYQRPAVPFFIANPQDLSDSFLQTVSKVIAHQVRSSDELACVLGLGNTDVTTFRRLEEQVLQLLRIWTQRENGDKMKLQKVLNRAKISLDVERIPRPKHASPGTCMQVYYRQHTYIQHNYMHSSKHSILSKIVTSDYSLYYKINTSSILVFPINFLEQSEFKIG